MSSGTEPTVEASTDGGLGVIRLNRPRALNALDHTMILEMRSVLDRWAHDDRIAAVWVHGAGERGLCSGGDVRAVRERLRAGDRELALGFFADEYALNEVIAAYPKPYVAWMDGVVMGGGIGISGHGSLRLVTERTKIAMPESIIGFFPDVGATWLLARAPGELGTHLALTGATVDGADAVAAGLADVVVSSEARDEVYADLVAATQGATAEQLTGWRPAEQHRATHAVSTLAEQRAWIDECYAGSDITVILDRLHECADPGGPEAAAMIESRSPHSVALTLEALRRSAGRTVGEVLEQDLRLARVVATHPDFDEGVRAQLVDKDRAPRWAHRHPSEVSTDEIRAAFDEL